MKIIILFDHRHIFAFILFFKLPYIMNLAINTNYAMTYGMIYFKKKLGATFGSSSLCSV
jgi:hypothetical protein